MKVEIDVGTKWSSMNARPYPFQTSVTDKTAWCSRYTNGLYPLEKILRLFSLDMAARENHN